MITSILAVTLAFIALRILTYRSPRQKYTTHKINRDCTGRNNDGPMATK